jgi:hypothetical protein
MRASGKRFVLLIWITIMGMGTLPQLKGQEMAGLVSSRFTGVNRGIINPAHFFDSPHCVDISLITFNTGFQNNYFYLPKGTLSYRELFNDYETHLEYLGNQITQYDGVKRAYGFQNLRLQGPSVLFKVKNHAFAITTGAREATSMQGFSDPMMKFIYKGLSYSPQHNILYSQTRSTRMASMSWSEIGLGYATRIRENAGDELVAGITLKRLWGYHGFSTRINNIDYLVNDTLDIITTTINMMTYSSLPVDYTNNEFVPGGYFSNGKGWAFDLGFTYTRKNTSQLPSIYRDKLKLNPYKPDYIYRLGVSLLDVGWVRYTNNPRQFGFNNANIYWEDPRSKNFKYLDQLLADLQSSLISGEMINQQPQSFNMFLPSAASVQFDYHLGNNFFAGLLWVQDLPLGAHRVARSSQIGIIPRYDTRWFTLAVPFTLHQYQKPRLGLAMRLGMLTIGTEQHGGLLGLNHLNGMDFYFSLNWGFCKREKAAGFPCHWTK